MQSSCHRPKSFVAGLVLLLLFLPSGLFGQQNKLFKAEIYSSEEGELPYRILFPEDLSTANYYPLILFLHGSGERGSDNQLQLKHGSDLFLSDNARERFPAFVVFPQCPAGESWNTAVYDTGRSDVDFQFPKRKKDNLQLKLLEGLIDELRASHNIDPSRIYIGGLSMGAMGTFEMVIRNPNLFAAAIAICGGADPKVARRIRKTPFWIFHGEEDQVVPPQYSIDIYEALTKKAADVKLTLYEGVEHDSWTPAFAEPDLLPWLFSKTRKIKN